MDNIKTKETNYESPVVEIIEINVEKGFATSGSSVSGWGNGGGYEASFDI